MLVGIDEVGRGAWAGPLVVVAVALDGQQIDGLTDSKLLSAKKRQAYARQIKRQAAGVGIGWVSAQHIDRHGLSKSLKNAAQAALDQINMPISEIVLDGTHNYIGDERVTTIKKADLLVPSVSAASIVAKVARDNYMSLLEGVFGGYGFAAHKGYGTKAHMAALARLGTRPVHRTSFAPVAKLVDSSQVTSGEPKTSTINSGQKAEQVAVNFLVKNGYKIVDTNWKTRWCEIDIIAIKNKTIHFVEVKYRKNALAGSGFEYITKKKRLQMQFAARLWLKMNQTDKQPLLSALALEGATMRIIDFIDNVEIVTC